ncbi:hypothetical protein D3C86_2163310 [compost metagenome]
MQNTEGVNQSVFGDTELRLALKNTINKIQLFLREIRLLQSSHVIVQLAYLACAD